MSGQTTPPNEIKEKERGRGWPGPTKFIAGPGHHHHWQRRGSRGAEGGGTLLSSPCPPRPFLGPSKSAWGRDLRSSLADPGRNTALVCVRVRKWVMGWGSPSVLHYPHRTPPQRHPGGRGQVESAPAGTREVHKRVPAHAASKICWQRGRGAGCHEIRHPSPPKGRPAKRAATRCPEGRPNREVIAGQVSLPRGKGCGQKGLMKDKSCPHPASTSHLPPREGGSAGWCPLSRRRAGRIVVQML